MNSWEEPFVLPFQKFEIHWSNNFAINKFLEAKQENFENHFFALKSLYRSLENLPEDAEIPWQEEEKMRIEVRTNWEQEEMLQQLLSIQAQHQEAKQQMENMLSEYATKRSLQKMMIQYRYAGANRITEEYIAKWEPFKDSLFSPSQWGNMCQEARKHLEKFSRVIQNFEQAVSYGEPVVVLLAGDIEKVVLTESEISEFYDLLSCLQQKREEAETRLTRLETISQDLAL